ncbi:MAG: Crp/Fnr family transcriptional regulator [Burkholderiales bacterium]|nr:Crp/Fnr family transcriptional regulator [Burkholderiales bacterium]
MVTTDFLGRLDREAREALLAQACRRRLRKGAFVYRICDRGDAVHFLLSGRIKTYKLTPDGREVILWFGFPGEVFGLVEPPHRRGRMVSVEACEPSEIAEIPGANFREFLDARPDVSRLLVQIMASRLGMLANRLVYFMADDAEARIAKFLVDLAARYHATADGAAAPIGLTHQEIADITGVQRQTATRILGRLTECGALSMHYRRISVRDRDLLSRYAARHR